MKTLAGIGAFASKSMGMAVIVALLAGCAAQGEPARDYQPKTQKETFTDNFKATVRECAGEFPDAKLVNFFEARNFIEDHQGERLVLLGKFGGKIQRVEAEGMSDLLYRLSYEDAKGNFHSFYADPVIVAPKSIAKEWAGYSKGDDSNFFGVAICKVDTKRWATPVCLVNKMCGFNAGGGMTFKSSVSNGNK